MYEQIEENTLEPGASYSDTDNAEELLNSIVARIHVYDELACEIAFLVDYRHHEDYGETLTDASYKHVLPSTKYKDRLTVFSEEVHDTFHRMYEKGGGYKRKIKRNNRMNLSTSRNAKIMDATPIDSVFDQELDGRVCMYLEDLEGLEDINRKVSDIVKQEFDTSVNQKIEI